MVINQSDFSLWKTEPVTEAFMEAAQDRIDEASYILSVQAGENPTHDNYLRGFIHAYREMQQFRVEDIQGDNE